ncbi:MAG: hypothetical protein IKU86_08315, partial [Thermoguttaceae bacterium]|nr:hypothetical protein [Thermoguttaceae bacterium]
MNAMTQENAADRAQAFEETPVAANESFAQDWLDAEKAEIADAANAVSRPRVVATMPDWTTFSQSLAEPRKGRGWRETLRSERARTAGVAAIAFGLGVFCASGVWFDGEKEKLESSNGATAVENASENELAAQNFGFGESENATPAIDSSTLRSVPTGAGVDALAAPIGNAEIAAILQGGAGSANFNDSASSANLGDSTASGDSSWRRGVDFERGLEPAATIASAERYPTWEELETNGFAAGTVAAGVPNLSVDGTPTDVASEFIATNRSYPSVNAQTAQNPNYVASADAGGYADYAGFNDGAGYRAKDAANLPTVSPELAGNSQNSGYNQVDGSENFAGFASSSSAVAPTAPNFASSSSAVAPTAPNFASS